ncbi:MAG: hypothetical protein IT176_15785 [Acidobacteria bacterium]|nr:hypothetical protein [Acidobacteriota bacterium]
MIVVTVQASAFRSARAGSDRESIAPRRRDVLPFEPAMLTERFGAEHAGEYAEDVRGLVTFRTRALRAVARVKSAPDR